MLFRSSQPKGPMSPHKEIQKEKKKKKGKREVGRKRRTPPSPNRIGVGVLLSTSVGALGAPLIPKASPSPPPIYTRGFRVFETQLCHVQPKPLLRSSSSRLVFYGARAEPCRNRSSPSPARRHATGELIYFPVSLAISRRRRSS